MANTILISAGRRICLVTMVTGNITARTAKLSPAAISPSRIGGRVKSRPSRLRKLQASAVVPSDEVRKWARQGRKRQELHQRPRHDLRQPTNREDLRDGKRLGTQINVRPDTRRQHEGKLRQKAIFAMPNQSSVHLRSDFSGISVPRKSSPQDHVRRSSFIASHQAGPAKTGCPMLGSGPPNKGETTAGS